MVYFNVNIHDHENDHEIMIIKDKVNFKLKV